MWSVGVFEHLFKEDSVGDKCCLCNPFANFDLNWRSDIIVMGVVDCKEGVIYLCGKPICFCGEDTL